MPRARPLSAVCMLVAGRPASACPPSACCVELSPGGASRSDTWRPGTGETGLHRALCGWPPAREAASELFRARSLVLKDQPAG